MIDAPSWLHAPVLYLVETNIHALWRNAQVAVDAREIRRVLQIRRLALQDLQFFVARQQGRKLATP